MELVRGIQSLSRALSRPVVTIGNFDGVHLGHRCIIGLAVEKARSRNGTAVAYTFRPHPQVALRPEAGVQLLSTYDEKLELIAALGVDLVVEEPFSREFSTTPSERFFEETLRSRLGAEAIVVGYDFAFGRGREGHLEALQAFCEKAGVELTVVPPQQGADGETVSSSRIRRQLLAGDVAAARLLLGREYSYQGIVAKGEGRGRQLGFPTANLRIEDKLMLPYGVYATRARVDGRVFDSITNIGVRPTFAGPEGSTPRVLVETHFLDASMDLYGRALEVFFLARLREERRFSGVEELKARIAADIEQARRTLLFLS